MVDSHGYTNHAGESAEHIYETEVIYDFDTGAPFHHKDCANRCLDVLSKVKYVENNDAFWQIHDNWIIKQEPDRYKAIREKTIHEDVPTHPNILKLSHFTFHEDADTFVFIYDVGYTVTTLKDYIVHASKEERFSLMKQAIELLQHFHKHKILHGNLQPENMYVAINEDKKPQLKVASFLQTSFCETRTERPEYMGSQNSEEESTMIEDLEDIVYLISYIYNERDNFSEDKIREVLYKMATDIETRSTVSVIVEICNALNLHQEDKTETNILVSPAQSTYSSNEQMIVPYKLNTNMSRNTGIVYFRYSSTLEEERTIIELEQRECLLKVFLVSGLKDVASTSTEEVRTIIEPEIREFLLNMILSGLKNTASVKFKLLKDFDSSSNFYYLDLIESGSSPCEPGLQIIFHECLLPFLENQKFTCKIFDINLHKDFSLQEFCLQSFPYFWEEMHPSLPERNDLAHYRFNFCKELNVFRFLCPCDSNNCIYSRNRNNFLDDLKISKQKFSKKDVWKKSHDSDFFQDGTRGHLAIK